jgi:protein O-GlcNAc transferase
VTWLDYFDTTGVPAIDYLISDPLHTPADSQQRFTERILRLPVTRLCFVAPASAPPVAPAPVLRRGHLTFGSFNRYAKTNLRVVALWARLLDAIPGAQLLLKANEFVDRGIRARALACFAAHGIHGDRITLRDPSPPPHCSPNMPTSTSRSTLSRTTAVRRRWTRYGWECLY